MCAGSGRRALCPNKGRASVPRRLYIAGDCHSHLPRRPARGWSRGRSHAHRAPTPASGSAAASALPLARTRRRHATCDNHVVAAAAMRGAERALPRPGRPRAHSSPRLASGRAAPPRPPGHHRPTPFSFSGTFRVLRRRAAGRGGGGGERRPRARHRRRHEEAQGPPARKATHWAASAQLRFAPSPGWPSPTDSDVKRNVPSSMNASWKPLSCPFMTKSEKEADAEIESRRREPRRRQGKGQAAS